MKPFAVTFASRQFGAWAFILTSAVVSRVLGPSVRGAVEGLATLRLGLHAVATAGVPAAATWLVARRRAPVEAVAGPAVAAALRLGVATAVGIAVAAFALPRLFEPIPPAWVAVFAAAAPATLAGQALAGVLLGQDRTTAWNLLAVLQRAVVLLALAALAVPPLRRAETVLVGMAAAEVAAALVAARLVGAAARPRRDAGALREARAYTRAAFLHGALSFAWVRGDLLVLSALAGTEASGLFAAASLAREMLLFVPWIASMLHVPKVAAATAGPGARPAPAPVGPVPVVVTLAVAVAIFAAPTGFVTAVHGDRFAGAGPLVQLLVPTALLTGLAQLRLAELLGRGAPLATWVAPGLAWALSMAGNLLFVPAHGATATAWTALVTSAALCLTASAGVAAARRGARADGA